MKENELGYQNFPAYTTKKTRNKKFVFALAVVFLLGLAGLGGLFVLGDSSRKEEVRMAEPTQSLTAINVLPSSSISAALIAVNTAIPSSTSGPALAGKDIKLDRSKLEVAVLNGSGVTGAAGAVSEYLKDLGYKIVSVDNADAYNYKNLTVFVKASKGNFAGMLKKDLQSNPDFASVSASVSNEITNEAVVIVGK
jgi:hypothetical protein